jgi:hypothetical protein
MGDEATYVMNLEKGTVLATFDRTTGKYSDRNPGEGGNNHTVIFLGWSRWAAVDGNTTRYHTAMRVVEQFAGPPRIRTIEFDNFKSNLPYHSNAGAFNVVRIKQ